MLGGLFQGRIQLRREKGEGVVRRSRTEREKQRRE